MSHEIGKHDKQQGLSMAWHNLTEVLPVIDLKTCFLSTWDVIKRPLFRIINGTPPVATSTCEVVSTVTDEVVGTTPKVVDANTYTLLTNARFLGLVADALLAIPGAMIESVGSVCNRARVFVTLRLPEFYTLGDKTVSATVLAGGREFKCFLNFLNSHDKSCVFTVVLSSICTVCNNTFGMNLADKDGKALRLNIKHTSGMEAHLADVPAIIGAFFATVERFVAVVNALALIPISETDARAWFVGFLYANEDAEDSATEADKIAMSGRRRNQTDRLTELFKTGKGNAGANLSDVFSAVTDYYTHESAGGIENASRQLASSEIPKAYGYTMKAVAFAMLQDDKRIAATIETGKRILAGQRAD